MSKNQSVEKRKKITSRRIFFDKEGNLYLPKKIKQAGELNLKTKEWLYLVLTLADKSKLPKGEYQKILRSICGSVSTQYRLKKSLKQKGYL